MLKLASGLHSRLDDRLIGMLNDRRILTVSDFLRTDSNKLKQYLNLDLMELTSIKMEFWKLIGISPISGFDHYNIISKQPIDIPTGIISLDEMLNGGLLPGNVIDVCGFSSSGKTQLYTTVAVNWAIRQDFETFVIDTKGDFSGDRIHRMLLSRCDFDADGRKRIMRCIKVERCSCPIKLIETLSHLIEQVDSFPRLKFLVIDSLPALWFLFHGTKNSLGYKMLAKLADLLRKLAVEHLIVVMTVNIETRLIVTNGDENAADDADRTDMDVTNRTQSSALCEITVPALGKHWKSICTLRLQVQRPVEASNSNDETFVAMTQSTNERTIRVLKSNQNLLKTCCVVHITNAGII